MISREEFDAEMAERDRRARLRAIAWDEAIGALDERMERLAASDRELAEVMQRLDATMAKFGETLIAQGGAIAVLWADYLRHKNEHNGGPA